MCCVTAGECKSNIKTTLRVTIIFFVILIILWRVGFLLRKRLPRRLIFRSCFGAADLQRVTLFMSGNCADGLGEAGVGSTEGITWSA